MSRPPPIVAPSAGTNVPSAASDRPLQAATPFEAKTLPKQRNMSRPPLPTKAQVISTTGLETAPPEAQSIPTLPKQRNMTCPSVPWQERAPAGVSTEAGTVHITAPHEAPTPAPLKQRNMTRPPLTDAMAPSMNQQGGAPIHLPIEASSLVVPKQRNMSRPPHPAKEGASDAMADSSIKQRNMTRPPPPVLDPTSRNMTRPTLPVPEASSSHNSAPLTGTVPPQLEDFEYGWADLDIVRQQCEDFPRNKVSHS